MFKIFLLVMGLLSILFYKAEIHKDKGTFHVTFDNESVARVESVKLKAKKMVDNSSLLD